MLGWLTFPVPLFHHSAGFTATVAPTSKEKFDNQEADVYMQGTKVNLKAYYDTCKAHNFQNLLIKAGNRETNAGFPLSAPHCHGMACRPTLASFPAAH